MNGLQNHWVEDPQWRPGRELWAFYLTFAQADGLHARVERDQAALSGIPGLAPIARHGLHMTVQGVTFRDLVPDAQIERLAEAVGSVVARRQLPRLYAGPATDDIDAVVLPVYPVEEIVALRDLLQLAAAELLGPERIHQFPPSAGGFVPHVSIAYAGADIPGPVLAEGLARTDQGLTAIDVRHLSLVALRRANQTWSWEQEIRLPFADRVAVS
ncbi:hypothetical protein GCM10027456_55900 [Kineosporia babensis]